MPCRCSAAQERKLFKEQITEQERRRLQREGEL
jgi:hypothetical protein